ncbi:MAG TPA: biotin--[acetyl-CoA-carboxylase] ligase [Candidatus Rubrimentiphilum sp.]|nr:biotin--[acetyl-CoA-carboxylase] ligase [Candidatus Rubrimentiphilum sp.]
MTRFEKIRYVESTGSTNDDIAKLLGEGEARGLTLVADFQTKGAGRKGRSWIAPPGSALLFTTALPEPVPSGDLWIVPFWIGLAVYEALANFGVRAQLQWPNDVLLNGAKLAGILCVSRVAGDEAWAACGVGINVRRPEDSNDIAGIDPPPAFLSDVRELERNELLQAILRRAGESYGSLQSPQSIAREWEKAALIPGARYRLLLDGAPAPFDATALALGKTGELLVDAAGSRRCVTMAQARVLRD